jgi:predicted ABC-type ATPase
VRHTPLHAKQRDEDIFLSEQKPLLVVIAGPMGAGKTTFYEAHLKEAFPTLIPPISHQREAVLREQRSFAVEDLVVDTELLESARDRGYATKVVFISTEDPNLNVGRILIRISRGGDSVPLSTIPESYEQSLKSLPEARKHADDVLVYDNTPDGKGHRLVARFIAGELVKTTPTAPGWLRSVIGRELRSASEQQKKAYDDAGHSL